MATELNVIRQEDLVFNQRKEVCREYFSLEVKEKGRVHYIN